MPPAWQRGAPYPRDMRFVERHPRLFLVLAGIGIGGYLFLSISQAQPTPTRPSIADQALDVQADAIVNERREYRGYECTSDCSGHEAGYEWAANQGVDNEDDCVSNSNSFTEGCLSYLEDDPVVH